MSVVIGIDPGLAALGHCRLFGEELLGAGVIRTKPDMGTEADRIIYITTLLRETIALTPEGVTLIAVETQHAQGGDPSTMRARAASAMSVAAVRGAVIEMAHSLSIAVVEVSPQEGKRALTGSGKADKQAMVKFARARFGETLAQDAADSVGIALAAGQIVAGRTPPRKRERKSGRAVRPEAVDGLPEHVKRAIEKGMRK